MELLPPANAFVPFVMLFSPNVSVLLAFVWFLYPNTAALLAVATLSVPPIVLFVPVAYAGAVNAVIVMIVAKYLMFIVLSPYF